MVLLLMGSIFVNYVLGLLLTRDWRWKFCKTVALLAMVTWNFGLLYYYKYYAFTLSQVNWLAGLNITIPSIIQPLGISFFTFRTISYCLDVYWGTVSKKQNLLDVALYICFFPQVLMGPITNYYEFYPQINSRKFDTDEFLDGIKRIVIGLAKKLIIADNIGLIVDPIFAMGCDERTIGLAWLGIFCYLIQLYYDFSGYSDIAIGIGKLLGFKTPTNFDYPFISKSVVEYWMRWHITLGTWLKVYLFTPLLMFCRNKNVAIGTSYVIALFGVWLFAGAWHGAGWNFICYGLYYFTFIVLERFYQDYRKTKRKKLGLKKRPNTPMENLAAHFYFFVVLIFGQLLFRSQDMAHFWQYCSTMFGTCSNALWSPLSGFYLSQSFVLLLVGWFFAFPILQAVRDKLKCKHIDALVAIFSPVMYCLLFITAIAFAITGTYQSFIYFQF